MSHAEHGAYRRRSWRRSLKIASILPLARLCRTRSARPTLICYEVDGKRYEKQPDDADLALVVRIAALSWPTDLPHDRMMHAPDGQASWGYKWKASTASFTHVHHLFLPRAAHAIAALWRKASAETDVRLRNMLSFLIEQAIWDLHRF